MANFRDRYKTLWTRGIEMKALILILTLSSSLNINANPKDNFEINTKGSQLELIEDEYKDCENELFYCGNKTLHIRFTDVIDGRFYVNMLLTQNYMEPQGAGSAVVLFNPIEVESSDQSFSIELSHFSFPWYVDLGLTKSDEDLDKIYEINYSKMVPGKLPRFWLWSYDDSDETPFFFEDLDADGIKELIFVEKAVGPRFTSEYVIYKSYSNTNSYRYFDTLGYDRSFEEIFANTPNALQSHAKIKADMILSYINTLKSKISNNWKYIGAKKGWSCIVSVRPDFQGNFSGDDIKIFSCDVDNKSKLSGFKNSIKWALLDSMPFEKPLEDGVVDEKIEFQIVYE